MDSVLAAADVARAVGSVFAGKADVVRVVGSRHVAADLRGAAAGGLPVVLLADPVVVVVVAAVVLLVRVAPGMLELVVREVLQVGKADLPGLAAAGGVRAFRGSVVRCAPDLVYCVGYAAGKVLLGGPGNLIGSYYPGFLKL